MSVIYGSLEDILQSKDLSLTGAGRIIPFAQHIEDEKFSRADYIYSYGARDLRQATENGILEKFGEWNSKKGEIKDERSNKQLTAFRNRIEQTYECILKNTGGGSADLLKNTIVGVNAAPTMLLQTGEEECKQSRYKETQSQVHSFLFSDKYTLPPS